MGRSSPKSVPSHRGSGHLDPIYYMILLVHPSPQPQRHRDWFSRFCTAHRRLSLSFTMAVHSPQNCSFPWGIWTHLMHSSPGPPESSTRRVHNYDTPTDRQTDRPRYSVYSIRPHLRTTVIRCGLIIINVAVNWIIRDCDFQFLKVKCLLQKLLIAEYMLTYGYY